MVEHRRRRAGGLHLIEIKRDGEQCALVDVSKIAIRKIAAERASARQYSSLAGGERERFDGSRIQTRNPTGRVLGGTLFPPARSGWSRAVVCTVAAISWPGECVHTAPRPPSPL